MHVILWSMYFIDSSHYCSPKTRLMVILLWRAGAPVFFGGGGEQEGHDAQKSSAAQADELLHSCMHAGRVVRGSGGRG